MKASDRGGWGRAAAQTGRRDHRSPRGGEDRGPRGGEAVGGGGDLVVLNTLLAAMSAMRKEARHQ